MKDDYTISFSLLHLYMSLQNVGRTYFLNLKGLRQNLSICVWSFVVSRSRWSGTVWEPCWPLTRCVCRGLPAAGPRASPRNIVPPARPQPSWGPTWQVPPKSPSQTEGPVHTFLPSATWRRPKLCGSAWAAVKSLKTRACKQPRVAGQRLNRKSAGLSRHRPEVKAHVGTISASRRRRCRWTLWITSALISRWRSFLLLVRPLGWWSRTEGSLMETTRQMVSGASHSLPAFFYLGEMNRY